MPTPSFSQGSTKTPDSASFSTQTETCSFWPNHRARSMTHFGIQVKYSLASRFARPTSVRSLMKSPGFTLRPRSSSMSIGNAPS